MLIESLIRPTNKTKRTVQVFGVDYEFTAVNGGSNFVAEVADQQAIDCLLKHTKLYRQFTQALPNAGPTLAKSPAPKPPATPEPETVVTPPADPPPPAATTPPVFDAPVTPPAGAENGGEDGSVTDATVAAAQALLSSTPNAIKKQVEKNTPSREVLAKAIAIESADKKPRQHVLACLNGALSALDA